MRQPPAWMNCLHFLIHADSRLRWEWFDAYVDRIMQWYRYRRQTPVCVRTPGVFCAGKLFLNGAKYDPLNEILLQKRVNNQYW